MFERSVAGRYRLTESLGSGGMATVWRAHDEVLDRAVAVKMLAEGAWSDASAVARFTQEALTVAGLDHPNIVTLFDAGVDDGVPFLVMELVEGTDLHALLGRGPLPIARAVSIADQVCAALEAAHRAGVVHRDIKPANLLLTTDGTVKVVDFGIARTTASARAALTSTATVVGTSSYMAPEQATGGRANPRTDLYAFGCVLYAMLTGQPPFEGEDPMAILFQHVHQPPVPPRQLRPEIPAGLEELVLDLLAKDPDQRPTDAGAARDRLARVGRASSARTVRLPALSPAGKGPAPTGPLQWVDRLGGRRAAALVLAALAATGLTGYVLAAGSPADHASARSTPPASVSPARTSPQPSSPATTASTAPSPDAAQTGQGTFDALQRAVAEAQNAGEIDADAAQDVRNRLGNLSRQLAKGRDGNPAHEIADLRHRLADLQKGGQLSDAGAQRIGSALDALAATLPA
ncbi:protein kinase [Streptacidiphilus sp. EB103A]|uniref:protein kinase domain-containing protein n=1 Tax=Streptacidiphilus sp. EB103A TaxID=3156275 RepID=UPI003517E413